MIEIRTAKQEDARRLLEIYDYYVTNTAVSLEYETPSLEEFTARMDWPGVLRIVAVLAFSRRCWTANPI